MIFLQPTLLLEKKNGIRKYVLVYFKLSGLAKNLTMLSIFKRKSEIGGSMIQKYWKR